jgi:ubiquinone/menaquinone biosynthesis C-methylase UbiE
MDQAPTEVQSSYDRVAAKYAEQFRDEMSEKPFDRKMLDSLAEKIDGHGVICDLGCGPGQIARYLHGRGVKACGIDLSPEMVRQAQRLHPDVPFRQGDMLRLTDVADNSYGGIAAFYSIIHVPRSSVVTALRELKRVLLPKGTLLLTFHIGQQVKRLDEWFDEKVSLDFIFFETEEMVSYLKTASFELENVIERDPYPEIEVQTRRAYVLASKP